jgi:AcrR family transcriptional regulator
LGAAYHYFPSKESMLMAYYEWTQTEHERLARAACPDDADSKTKLRSLFVTKVNLLRKDRKLLAALFRNLGDPSHPLSVFGRQTAVVRAQSIALFEQAFAQPHTPGDFQKVLGRVFWLAHLAIFLFFIHDRSPGQLRTQTLINALVDLTGWAVPLLRHQGAAPLRQKLMTLMADLGFAEEVL